MAKEYTENMDRHYIIEAKSWVDELLHQCPNTKDFFDKDKDLRDLTSRHEQKLDWIAEHGNFKASDAMKTMTVNKVGTITSERSKFNNFAQYLISSGRASDFKSGLTFKCIKGYLMDRQEMVMEGKIKISTFEQDCYAMRKLCVYSTNTAGYPNVDVDRISHKLFDEAKGKLEETHQLVPEGNDRRAYTPNEQEAILSHVADPQARAVLNLGFATGFRLDNLAHVYIDTKWEATNDSGKIHYQRVPCEGCIAVRAKGNQLRTVDISRIDGGKLAENLRQFADKDGGIHMSHRSLENKWSEACRAVDKNLPTGIHNIRYTFATRMYNELRAEGMSEKRAEKAVSESLFHHREEITRHYLK